MTSTRALRCLESEVSKEPGHLRVSSEDTGLSAPSLVITADRVDKDPVPPWSPTPLTSWLLPESKDCLWRKEVEGAHCVPTCPKTITLPGAPLTCLLSPAEAPVHLLTKLRDLFSFLCLYCTHSFSKFWEDGMHSVLPS